MIMVKPPLSQRSFYAIDIVHCTKYIVKCREKKYLLGVNFVTSGRAREILAIEGRPINIRTFDKLVKAGLIKEMGRNDYTNERIFLEENVVALKKYFPKKKQPSRVSIVAYVKEQMKGGRK
jgi:hypothetical protein